MTDRERPIKALGEIALRVTDLDTMQRFYEEIVGLEVMRRAENAVFFKIADRYEGHTQVLALCDRSSSPVIGNSTPQLPRLTTSPSRLPWLIMNRRR